MTIDSTRCIPWIGGGMSTGLFRTLGLWTTISIVLLAFSFKLLAVAQAAISSISLCIDSEFVGGTMRYVSSAYLQRSLPTMDGLRSDELTSYSAGPTPDPCTIEALIGRSCEKPAEYLVHCLRPPR